MNSLSISGTAELLKWRMWNKCADVCTAKGPDHESHAVHHTAFCISWRTLLSSYSRHDSLSAVLRSLHSVYAGLKDSKPVKSLSLEIISVPHLQLFH